MTKRSPARKKTNGKASSSPRAISQNEKTAKSIKAKADEKRSFMEIIADRTTALFGSNIFLFGNVLFFVAWIVINTGLIPGIKPFDEFPFPLLTTAVSLEAIFLTILVLISENRAAKVADLREEVQLQVNILTEEEITRIMWMLVRLLQKNDIQIPEDERLKEMLRETDIEKIEKSMKKQIEKS
jgi:uncharacterized membrane protein